MIETSCLIDTDILSYLLKGNETVVKRNKEYVKEMGYLTISCLTYYECMRGYLAVGSTKRMKVFEELMQETEIIYLDPPVLRKAANVYSVLKPKGLLSGELDLLI